MTPALDPDLPLAPMSSAADHDRLQPITLPDGTLIYPALYAPRNKWLMPESWE